MKNRTKQAASCLAITTALWGSVACSTDGDDPAANEKTSSPQTDSSKTDASHTDATVVTTESDALFQLSQKGMTVQGGGTSPTKLAGMLGAGAPNPTSAAEKFAKENSKALRIDADDLSTTTPPGRESELRTPILYEPQSGKYKFTRVSYGQARGGIPVYGARIDILVRNEPGNPVVMATSDARTLGQFEPRLAGALVDRAKLRATLVKKMQAGSFSAKLKNTASGLDQLGDAEPVIWAGTRVAPEAPRLAATYIAESSTGPERVRVVADAETGDVLFQEDLIVFEAVSGHVSGNASLDTKALNCSEPGAAPFPHARVDHGTDSTFADGTGSYSFDAPADAELTVSSPIAGAYFVVNDQSIVPDEVLTSNVTPPATVDFLHNAAASGEYLLGQVNGYVHANQVRDWLLNIHPAYPTIFTQTGFPVNVNIRSGGFCPGNAWYDGVSINFCSSSDEYANTSFASVNHHEFGHHVVESGGSGQGAYGEGMSDVVAMLLSDDPGLGYGFFLNQCDTPLRNADNDCQYIPGACSTCGSEVHDCGNLISGAVWDVRKALAESDPESALSIVSALAVNSVLLHSGQAITPQIATDFLVLDDDDGDIGNGTPHREAICAGFDAHNLDCPELETGLSVSPITAFTTGSETEGGPFLPASDVYTLTNRGPGNLDFSVSVDVDWIHVDVTSGSLDEGNTQDITVSVNEEVAADLPLGDYLGTLTFDDVTGVGDDITVPVSLKVGSPTSKYAWNLDVDPGWTRQGQWGFGVPQGRGGDPTAGSSGENVFGFNLSGKYGPNMGRRHLTTGAIDCTHLSDVSLRFQRWLGVEENTFDHASVSVSTDLEAWTTVWQNPRINLNDTAWTPQTIDISDVADGSPKVYVRFTMGTTDGSVQYAGWNIDDIEIWGLGEAQSGCASDADCDDGAFCNGIETCTDGACSLGTQVACDDGVGCTLDYCDEGTDSCMAFPRSQQCDNGLFCDGEEICDQILGCTPGEAPCEGDICREDLAMCIEETFVAAVRITSASETGYCAAIDVSNYESTSTISWSVGVDLMGSVMTSGRGADFVETELGFEATSRAWNAVVNPGQTRAVASFCGDFTGDATFPEVATASAQY